MKTLVAKGAGCCFGVNRAIDLAFKIAKKYKGGVYTIGPIIHNPQVVAKLSEEGVKPIDDIAELEGLDVKALLIRTHGIPQDIMQKLKDKGYTIIDATCPFVKKAQHYAKLLKEKGYQVIILGDREHPEVKGLLSYAGSGAIVAADSSELPVLRQKIGIVVQTTQNVEALKRFLNDIVAETKEIKVFNTICNSTSLRLHETAEMANKVDVMIIVGGKNSANTTQLANLCRSLSVPTYHIETASELQDEWFAHAGMVGISAGASTPEWLIMEVEYKILHTGGSDFDGT